MSSVPTKELTELENQIKKSYDSSSIIDKVCIAKEVSSYYKHGQFSQFANRLLIEKEHIIDPSHYLILGEIGTSVVRNEINCIVEDISKKCCSKEFEKIEYIDIVNGVFELSAKQYIPNHIFLPIDYFHKVHDWNKDRIDKIDFTKGSIFDQLYIDSFGAVKVTYSNKYVPFENIVITCKECNIWEYRPDPDTNKRLTVKFDWNEEDPENAILLVKTVFNFVPVQDGNLVLKTKNVSE
ncbi:hypothetical protein AAA799B03_00959 [Marine Group I thaumarchaeote SCGC AAA799-B03]|uniref:Uncharacterized protein n=1 Tax=Marine Group I thaumarchaeote SCGC AAA799-B03 TaxID=1502289 RepID=A0A087S6Y4_9ARCH|nr:hypothetical protein AAA799B03_00959 [Marine Group I thaumarchaeote SCGC AAA799-B03]